MKIKSKYYKIMEGARLNIQYEMFDEMFSTEHGGDYDDFITWIHSKKIVLNNSLLSMTMMFLLAILINGLKTEGY